MYGVAGSGIDIIIPKNKRDVTWKAIPGRKIKASRTQFVTE
jgi:hypothetical protein